MVNSRDFEEGTFLLSTLLDEIADQIPERMHLVWADEDTPSGHPHRAVSVYNASLSIDWGRAAFDLPEGPPRGVETEWSRKLPDPEVFQQHLDVLLQGAAIYRLNISLVDGARCWIPSPRPGAGDEFAVSQWSASVVALANDLLHTTNTHDYLTSADIRIIGTPPV